MDSSFQGALYYCTALAWSFALWSFAGALPWSSALMSFAGGTATWQRSRKRARVASSVEHEFEYEEFHEVIDEGADEHKEDGVDDREHAPQDEDADSSSATIISSTLYEAVVDIFTPTNEVKKRTGELLLKARERAGQYNLFAGCVVGNLLAPVDACC
jgi:hypothetical protein